MRRAKPLPRSFYERDVVTVSRELLGKVVVHQVGGVLLGGRIVETEAYEGSEPACHAYQRRTARVEGLYGRAGHAYVYFSYGMHWMLNVVTGPVDFAAAVLVRALEPVAGIAAMRAYRGEVPHRELMRGPGKLAQALAIGSSQNGADMTRGTLTIRDTAGMRPVRVSARIGISKAVELPWRFYVDSPYVSKARPKH
ncbi:MAG: DNA-3-methyladenine glycosylase [Myxococcota bacterium]|nr:DNA-3-methyladenine glycosylase [Myxococcota bacterium]